MLKPSDLSNWGDNSMLEQEIDSAIEASAKVSRDKIIILSADLPSYSQYSWTRLKKEYAQHWDIYEEFGDQFGSTKLIFLPKRPTTPTRSIGSMYTGPNTWDK